MNVVLIGFMGTGKSAVGQALARRLEAHFVDTDAEIERQAGKPIRQIFEDDGEAAFRARETAVLEQLASAPAPPFLGVGGGRANGSVIATGGGTPLRLENAHLLRQIGCVVWLTAPAETILRRVGPDLRRRPLLASFQDDPQARIENLLAERVPRYDAAAHLTWDTSQSETAEEVAALLADQLCQPAA